MKNILTALFMCLGLGTHAQSLHENPVGDLATGINDPLAGKVINVLGDSYVKNHRRPVEEAWHYKVAEHHGMKYNNYGRNGGCVAFDRTKEGFGPSLLVRYKEMDENADLVLIIAGHNDAGKVGTSKDSLVMFTDSVAKLIDCIRVQCPKAKVAWCTPWYVDRAGFKPVVKAIKKVCKKGKVAVLDNYSKKCVIKVRDDDFRAKYFQGKNDTAHLNKNGHELFVPVGDAFIKKVLQ